MTESISTARSGTALSRIYIKAANSSKPSVNGLSFGHAYVTVDGFRINNTGTAVSVGGGGSYCEILNSEFNGAENAISMSGSPASCRIR